jgi:hypothetical protein
MSHVLIAKKNCSQKADITFDCCHFYPAGIRTSVLPCPRSYRLLDHASPGFCLRFDNKGPNQGTGWLPGIRRWFHAQPAKTFLLLQKTKVCYRVHMFQPLDHFLSEMNQSHYLKTVSLQFNLILPFHRYLGLPSVCYILQIECITYFSITLYYVSQ